MEKSKKGFASIGSGGFYRRGTSKPHVWDASIEIINITTL